MVEGFFLSQYFEINERSQVASARRGITKMAQEHGLDRSAISRLEIIVTEAATNILKHAGRGRLMANKTTLTAKKGITVLALDSGPGMEEIQQCLEDGYSTSGSPGTGMGAMLRLSDSFDAYSTPGKGTVIAAEVCSGDPGKEAALFDVSGWCLPHPGEEVSGDAWSAQEHLGRLAVLVIDGLGHGEQAQEAALQGLEIFDQCRVMPPERIIEELHFGLRHSRGAAAAAAVITEDRLHYSGVGNIAGMVVTGPQVKHLMSHNGIVGHQARKIQCLEYPLARNSAVAINSDGISTWNPDIYPGLFAKKPALAAGILFAEHRRARDDATVVVIKRRSDAAPFVAH